MRSVSRGVIVDYFLKQPADAVTIEFADAAGQTIRQFTSTAEPAREAARPADADEEEGGGRGGAGRARDQHAGDEPVHVGHALPERA